MKYLIVEGVSIHAPAWGATFSILEIFWNTASFNPRARVGRDMHERTLTNCVVCFNPRARVGRDPCQQALGRRMWSFNPRARVGRDGHG